MVARRAWMGYRFAVSSESCSPLICHHRRFAIIARPRFLRGRVVFCLITIFCSSFFSQAVTNLFYPVADTSLLEVSPTNNLGGYPGMNAGTTQEFKRTRALMRFDFSSLPTNTLIL